MTILRYFRNKMGKKENEYSIFLRETIQKLRNLKNIDIQSVFKEIKERERKDKSFLYDLLHEILKEFFPIETNDSIAVVWDFHLAYTSVLVEVEYIESDLSEDKFIRFKAVTKYGLLFTIDFHADGEIEYDLVSL